MSLPAFRPDVHVERHRARLDREARGHAVEALRQEVGVRDGVVLAPHDVPGEGTDGRRAGHQRQGLVGDRGGWTPQGRHNPGEEGERPVHAVIRPYTASAPQVCNY